MHRPISNSDVAEIWLRVASHRADKGDQAGAEQAVANAKIFRADLIVPDRR